MITAEMCAIHLIDVLCSNIQQAMRGFLIAMIYKYDTKLGYTKALAFYLLSVCALHCKRSTDITQLHQWQDHDSFVLGKSKRKIEKTKDFVGPKKPANAFLLFCQHRRTAVAEEYLKVC